MGAVVGVVVAAVIAPCNCIEMVKFCKHNLANAHPKKDMMRTVAIAGVNHPKI